MINTTPRTGMPSVDSVIEYWQNEDVDWLKSCYIGWGELLCVLCSRRPAAGRGRIDRSAVENYIVSQEVHSTTSVGRKATRAERLSQPAEVLHLQQQKVTHVEI